MTSDSTQVEQELATVKAEVDGTTASIKVEASTESATTAIDGVDTARDTLDGKGASIKLSASDTASEVIDRIKSSLKELTGGTFNVTIHAKVDSNEGVGATGTIGLALGTLGIARAAGTLMGELGPELVVSNGHYFVAGQNGPEMVNLSDDAIVFNHL